MWFHGLESKYQSLLNLYTVSSSVFNLLMMTRLFAVVL